MSLKRFVTLIFLTLFVSTAYAEEFTVRNGIAFGDDIETVRQKETEPLIESESTSDLRIELTQLGSIEDLTIYYSFSDNNKLNSIVWVCGEYPQEKKQLMLIKILRKL